jgi:hypothetical protein
MHIPDIFTKERENYVLPPRYMIDVRLQWTFEMASCLA